MKLALAIARRVGLRMQVRIEAGSDVLRLRFSLDRVLLIDR